ncbi:disulfide bond formation protein B [Saccharibacter sp. 17.LH.SD]|uniref:disulfide bond formation protein B n=1 Tax=Saccharibacter sp. 17.LH.SD TaxID=2689393 RepID=UPI00351B94E9
MLSGLCALLVALGAEHYLHLVPCELCLWERRPWRVLIALGILTLVLSPRYARWPVLMGIMCLLVSFGLSVMHVGVEQGWWPSPAAECHVGAVHAQNFDAWMKQLPVRPTKPCDQPDYLFGFPLSMTTLSGIYALTVLVTALVGAAHLFRDVRRG